MALCTADFDVPGTMTRLAGRGMGEWEQSGRAYPEENYSGRLQLFVAWHTFGILHVKQLL